METFLLEIYNLFIKYQLNVDNQPKVLNSGHKHLTNVPGAISPYEENPSSGGRKVEAAGPHISLRKTPQTVISRGAADAKSTKYGTTISALRVGVSHDDAPAAVGASRQSTQA